LQHYSPSRWSCCCPAGSGDYKTSWTIRNGGWPRYISTNIAGMWRQVFKVKEVKGLEVRLQCC
jgi:hypothetical protein